jgi:antitoxin MazE
MKVLVKKWGNSAAVRIPTSVMEAAHLNLDQSVEVKEENGRIVIEPDRPRVFSLKNLLDGITPANLHHPVDTGSPVGREVW